MKRFDALASMGLHTISNVPVARMAIEVALATGRTVYDSLYIALAMNEGCRFVTADERLVNGLASTPYQVHAIWLGTM